MQYNNELDEAKKIARLAGKILLKYFDIDQGVQSKADNSSVTKADILINDLVIEELTKTFPDDGIIGEEKSTATYGKGRKWFCDPIDGTAGYIWGTPTAMFSLALVVDGEPVLGVVYDAFLDRLYESVKGEGSFCNRVKIKVSQKELKGGSVAITSDPVRIRNLDFVSTLIDESCYLPVFSGAVYKSCLVARGKFEGYIESSVSTYDMAAVQVIVGEAGGKVTGLKGERLDYSTPFRGAIVSNGVVHDRLVEIVHAK